MILSASQLLFAQVKLLLDQNLIDGNHFVPQLSQVDMGELVNETIQILQGTADLKGLQINYSSDIFNDKIMADSMRL